MVKGVSRQVIVVRPPETRLFEQAIFLLRDDALDGGVTDEQLLKQAHQAADSYLRAAQLENPHRRRLAAVGWAALGAAVVGLTWILTLLF